MTSASIPSSSSTNCWLYPSSIDVRLWHSWFRQEKGSMHLRINAWQSSTASHTESTKPMTIYGARSKVSCVNRILTSLLLSYGRCHGLITSHGLTGYERPSYKVQLKTDTSWDSNVRSDKRTSKCGQKWYWNAWESLPTDHPVGGCPFLLLLDTPDDWDRYGTDEEDGDSHLAVVMNSTFIQVRNG